MRLNKLVIIFLLGPVWLFAQKDTAISFSGVVKVDSISKDDLYIRARDWFNGNFKDSKAVLQIQDKEAGEISGKGVFTTYYKHSNLGVQNGYDQNFGFKVTIWVKDGRYKYELSNFDNYYSGNSYGAAISFGVITSSDICPVKIPMQSKSKTDALYVDTKKRAIAMANTLIETLKISMGKKTTPDF